MGHDSWRTAFVSVIRPLWKVRNKGGGVGVTHRSESRVVECLWYESLETEKVPITGYILLLHLFQRFYESFFIQRSVSKMSVIHYGVGITFYFLLPLQFVSSEISEEFSHSSLEYISLTGMLISIFGQHKWWVSCWFWYFDHSFSIRTMANLRKDSDGIRLPRGGLFELVTSPHFTFEILFFFFFWLGTENRMLLPLVFTTSNQVVSALWTFEFYKLKFPDEMESRRAIIPFILWSTALTLQHDYTTCLQPTSVQ